MTDQDTRLVDASGRPLPPQTSTGVPKACPGCGSPPDKRMLSAGFGQPHDVCIRCGHEFSLAETRRA